MRNLSLLTPAHYARSRPRGQTQSREFLAPGERKSRESQLPQRSIDAIAVLAHDPPVPADRIAPQRCHRSTGANHGRADANRQRRELTAIDLAVGADREPEHAVAFRRDQLAVRV